MNPRSVDSTEDDDDWAVAPTVGRLYFEASDADSGERLDKALATWMPEVSRNRIKGWIEEGAVRVAGAHVRPRHLLQTGDKVVVEPRAAPEASAFTAESIPIEVVYEDADLLVIDKPAGLVVHPAAGNWSGTLLNGLLACAPELAKLPRAGIVHRLDAGTSGLLVVARTESAQLDLVRQLQARTVEREYWAIVLGKPPGSGTIDAAIARDRRDPRRFRVSTGESAKPARTHYEIQQTVREAGVELSWLSCRLETGRTHQIRVHLEHLGFPLIGDPIYRRRLPSAAGAVGAGWRSFARQALHAHRLGLMHPRTRHPMSWTRSPPADMDGLMNTLGFDRNAPARTLARKRA